MKTESTFITQVKATVCSVCMCVFEGKTRKNSDSSTLRRSDGGLYFQPNSGSTLESRPKSNLHDSVSLLERVCFLFFLDVFKFVPDRGRAGVSKIIKRQS
jgi:hypothetical protein